METESNCVTICFYLGKPCRYGDDAPPEEQMECSQCPAYVMWCELKYGPRRFSDSDGLTPQEEHLDYDK